MSKTMVKGEKYKDKPELSTLLRENTWYMHIYGIYR